MRIRSIRPEFWRSKAISCLPIEDRLLFIGLWSYVDDNGVGIDRLSLITADLFADDLENDPRETFARVSRGLARLSAAGRITRYTVENTDYLCITNWTEHQKIDRPGKNRYPALTTENAVIRESVASESRDRRETPSTGEGEKGRRGEGEKTSTSGSADAESRTDIEEILDHLDNALVENGFTKPNRTKHNLAAARLLIDRDGRTVDQIKACIDFATQDEFWRPNIRSMSKLRDKYEQLRAKAAQRNNVHQLPTAKPSRTPEPGIDYEEAPFIPILDIVTEEK